MASDDTPVPVEEGEEYVLDIEDQGEEGDGVAHVQEFVVLVPGGDIGEQVRVRIQDVGDDQATAEVLEHETNIES